MERALGAQERGGAPPGALEKAVSETWHLPWVLKDIAFARVKKVWGYLNQRVARAKMKINACSSVARSWGL